MPQKMVEAEQFINRILTLPPGPGVSLDDALKPAVGEEYALRQLWASDRDNDKLKNIHVGLVDLFAAPTALRTTRARVVKDEEDLSAKYVIPLDEINRREEGAPSVVNDIDEFKKNWAIFTEGSLSQLLDWSNVVAAGGSVLACLTPLSGEAKASKRATRKYYHGSAYPTSDIDLFLYGMSAEEAEKKIIQIYEAVRDSVPWDVTCVRTKHTISIHSQYPYRSVQIVLRLYQSPAEILAGFDIDAPCVAYDGSRIWANPRSVVAMMRQCNTIDVTRRSPSYEVRLAKYSGRGFEVFVPTLERNDVDPTIYERSIARIEGLARLLVFEKLTDTATRYNFLEGRRQLRGRPNPLNRYRRKRVLKGDLKADTAIGGLEMNDYDIAVLHIPYGPGWDARRIDKLVYSTDLGMNSTFNPKNKGRKLHRHPAFFGTMEECMEDCCELCPEPRDDEEKELQEKEDEQYIRGRISFMEENPGRQAMSGSFNPIDDGEWAEQVYMGDVEKLFNAIARKDRTTVQAILASESFDVTHRDHVGRSPLHVAILCGAEDIACDLIDAGVRITARLVDGRAALHLAAQRGQVQVIEKLIDRSKANEEQKKEELAKQKVKDNDVEMKEGDRGEEKNGDDESPEKEDEDWMSVDIDKSEDEVGQDDDNEQGGDKKNKAGRGQSGDIPEDEEGEPDIIDINAEDWDIAFSPLFYAITSASIPAIDALINEGADIHLTVNRRGYDGGAYNALSCTFFIRDKEKAIRTVERLLQAGCTSSEADKQSRTVFHSAVHNEKLHLVKAFLQKDPNAKIVINYPCVIHRSIVTPLVTAVNNRSYSAVAILLAYDAPITLSEEEAARADQNLGNNRIYGSVMTRITKPLEISFALRDHISSVLISAGANVSEYIRECQGAAEQEQTQYHGTVFTLLDWVYFAKSEMHRNIERHPPKLDDSYVNTSAPVEDVEQYTGWKGFYKELHQKEQRAIMAEYEANGKKQPDYQNDYNARTRRDAQEALAYFEEIEKLLLANSAKTRKELLTGKKEKSEEKEEEKEKRQDDESKQQDVYHPMYVRLSLDVQIAKHLEPLYDELFEAAFKGDNEKVQKLCLPSVGTDIKDLLLVAVAMTPHSTRVGTGMTPLVAAITGRRWETARLILAIASAQYTPPEDDSTFSVRDIFLDEYENSNDDEEDHAPPPKINFVDIAKKASVTCNIHPSKLLDVMAVYYTKDLLAEDPNTLIRLSLPPLGATIYNDDFDGFRHIANMYMSINHTLTGYYHYTLDNLLAYDRPEMLDYIIRFTGTGIEHVVSADTEDDPTNDSTKREDLHVLMKRKKFYLGLTVHGKKRSDLARVNDPSVNHAPKPLVWQAIQKQAFKIVEYLSSARPLEAYRFYASSNSDDDCAERLCRAPNLPDTLPTWLGWNIDVNGESPLTAAIVANKKEMFEKLLEWSPKLSSTALHEKVKFYGHNLFLLACEVSNLTIEFVDLLLKLKVSPVERESIHGQNVFHILANRGNNDLISHLLNVLPHDVVEVLLSQQTKQMQNTPLHVAIKQGRKYTVEVLLPVSSHILNVRDMNGSTPLHVAVQFGYSCIVERLLKEYPEEAIYTENGIGEIPRETAGFRDLLQRTQKNFQAITGDYGWLGDTHVPVLPRPFNVDKVEKELPKLRVVLQELQEQGKLVKGSELSNTLLSFAGMMEGKLHNIKAQREAENQPKPKAEEEEKMAAKQERDKTDYSDWSRTLEVLSEKHAEGEQPRHLVHLLDVQKSIQLHLQRPIDTNKTTGGNNKGNDDVLADEDSAEDKMKSRMLVGHKLTITQDV